MSASQCHFICNQILTLHPCVVPKYINITLIFSSTFSLMPNLKFDYIGHVRSWKRKIDNSPKPHNPVRMFDLHSHYALMHFSTLQPRFVPGLVLEFSEILYMECVCGSSSSGKTDAATSFRQCNQTGHNVCHQLDQR